MSGTIRISITGDLGSGKSTVCDVLKRKCSFLVYSTGKIQRQIAEEKNLSTLELNTYAETHPEIDDEIDRALAKLSQIDVNFVVDSRMAWHFVPETFKVCLTADRTVAARRVMKDSRGGSESYRNPEDARRQLSARRHSENARYRSLYGVDCARLRNFDCVIDTTFATPEEVAACVLKRQRDWKRGDRVLCILSSPRRLLPTRHMSDEIDLDAALFGDHPVRLLYAEGNYYIFHGHEEVAESIVRGDNMISCRLEAEEEEILPSGLTARQHVRKNCTPSCLDNWEVYNGFSFASRPSHS